MEEVGLVFRSPNERQEGQLDRTTYEAAEFVFIVLRSRVAGGPVVGKRQCIQIFVAKVLKAAAVERVAAASGCHDDLATRGGTVFRLVARSQHAYFADHIWRGRKVEERN